jgi:VanZ family protein
MARLGRIVPPLLLMGLIFFLSAQPDLNSGLGGWDLILRKGAHMTEYGLLWFLWTRVFGPLPALAIALAYAATDEFHQTFVHGRSGTPVDWAIDAAGVAIAVVLWIAWRRRRAREALLVAEVTRTR